MSKRIAPTIGLFWRLTVISLLVGSMFVAGCGRSDVVSPVSEQEMDELELEFDDGLQAPEDVPSAPNEVPNDNP